MPDNLPARRAVSLDDVTTLDDALRYCDVISQSGLLPPALRGSPANVLLVFLMGREIGLSLAQAVREIYVPSGGQPQMRGRLLLARLRGAGHDYWWEDGEDSCTFCLKRGDSGREYETTFTLQDAEAAGLVHRNADGEIVAISANGKPLPWQAWQKDMLFWRAVARGVNRAAPEVAMGFDLMEAGPAPDSQPPADAAGMVPEAASAGTAPAPPPPRPEPGPPSAEAAAELAELDAKGAQWRPLEDAETRAEPPGDGPASREELQQLADAFSELGWLPRKHKATILEACTAFCGRPVLAVQDLTSLEVHRIIADMSDIQGPAEALPVLLADRAEVWRQRVRDADPDLAAALFDG